MVTSCAAQTKPTTKRSPSQPALIDHQAIDVEHAPSILPRPPLDPKWEKLYARLERERLAWPEHCAGGVIQGVWPVEEELERLALKQISDEFLGLGDIRAVKAGEEVAITDEQIIDQIQARLFAYDVADYALGRYERARQDCCPKCFQIKVEALKREIPYLYREIGLCLLIREQIKGRSKLRMLQMCAMVPAEISESISACGGAVEK